MKAVTKQYVVTVLLVLVLLIMYGAFAYDLNREDFTKLITLYTALFAISYTVFNRLRDRFLILAGIAVAVRLVYIPATPELSQDFYRFLWDGRLLAQGINPYLSTVQAYIDNGNFPLAQAQELFAGMGSLNAGHYSNYPPINQICFAVAGSLFPKSIIGSVITLRLIIILADLGILYFGRKLLKSLKLPEYSIFFFILNPFVVIEFTGNLHFETVMLFFFVWALYLLKKKQWHWAGILIGLSISVKLIPLLLLPIFFKYFRKRNENESELEKTEKEAILQQLKQVHSSKLIGFYVIIMGTVLLTFLPFLSSEFISNFSATIGLWFQNFEFNASFYYIIRWIGYKVVGWNIIEIVGKVLPLVVIAIILMLSVFRRHITMRQMITGLLFAVTAYLLLSTTVHPWYIATPLLLGVFTRYRFPIVWSLVVFLSYSAYGETFNEKLWLVALEYCIMVGYATYEIYALNQNRISSE